MTVCDGEQHPLNQRALFINTHTPLLSHGDQIPGIRKHIESNAIPFRWIVHQNIANKFQANTQNYLSNYRNGQIQPNGFKTGRVPINNSVCLMLLCVIVVVVCIVGVLLLSFGRVYVYSFTFWTVTMNQLGKESTVFMHTSWRLWQNANHFDFFSSIFNHRNGQWSPLVQHIVG